MADHEYLRIIEKYYSKIWDLITVLMENNHLEDKLGTSLVIELEDVEY